MPIDTDDFLNVAVRGGALSRDVPSVVNPYLLGGLLNLSGLRYQQLEGQLPRPSAASSTITGSRGSPISAATSTPADRSRPATRGSSASDASAGDLVTAGSVFLAADTFLGPFYFAYGRASGGASSFYLLLGRP